MPGIEGAPPSAEELKELRRRALAKLAEIGHGTSRAGSPDGCVLKVVWDHAYRLYATPLKNCMGPHFKGVPMGSHFKFVQNGSIHELSVKQYRYLCLSHIIPLLKTYLFR